LIKLKESRMSRPRPIGSPYGFKAVDWDTVIDRKSRVNELFVVLGYQFKSVNYDGEQLLKNLETMFRRAMEYYNDVTSSVKAQLDFRGLGAGYGGHLFNEIARDIIASDIAVFDTSDQIQMFT